MSTDLQEHRFRRGGRHYLAVWERMSARSTRWTVSLRVLEQGEPLTIASADVQDGEPLRLQAEETDELNPRELQHLSRATEKARARMTARVPRELQAERFKQPERTK